MANWMKYIAEEENDIMKSELDTSSYRVLKLTNGMKICLVSSPNTEWASATMDVRVGSMSDPNDIPGLAHLCEHLLFMGSEKYPAENDFDAHIRKWGGESNGKTGAEHTNYCFDIKSDYLSEGLDRFAQFFICPLFTKYAIDKEVNVINSESAGKGTYDDCRIGRVEMETMNLDHPFCKFPTGNKETLFNIPMHRGQDIQTEVVKFYKKYYSSNIMSLAVYGRESLDELAEMVIPLFSQVANNYISVPVCTENPIRDMDTQLQINIVPNSDIKKLTLTFPVENYWSHPCGYVNHLMGVCGAGSLSSLLKLKGWVNLVESLESRLTGFSFLEVRMDLTDTGMRHIDEIITSVFQYITMLRTEGVRKRIWHECNDGIHFIFIHGE